MMTVSETAEIREIRDELRELAKSVARQEALLSDSVVKRIDNIDVRLDRHSNRLDALEKTAHYAGAMRQTVAWIVGTSLTAIGVAVSVAKLIVN